MLRRLGGRSLQAGGNELPPYFDANYGCTMEVLRFDSAEPNERFVSRILDLQACLAATPVVTTNSCSDCTQYQIGCSLPAAQAFDQPVLIREFA